MATKYKLQEIYHLQESKIFVDTNILIYIFWPTNSYNEKVYSKALSGLLKQGNKLYINFLVISEAINRMIRIEYSKNSYFTNFKDYRDSKDGKQALEDIYTIIKDDILNRFKIIDKGFNKEEIEKFLIVEDIDIIDNAIVNVCKENDMILLTHDGDFKNTNINILSNNKYMFN